MLGSWRDYHSRSASLIRIVSSPAFGQLGVDAGQVVGDPVEESADLIGVDAVPGGGELPAAHVPGPQWAVRRGAVFARRWPLGFRRSKDAWEEARTTGTSFLWVAWKGWPCRSGPAGPPRPAVAASVGGTATGSPVIDSFALRADPGTRPMNG
jgi:hypothetical protein